MTGLKVVKNSQRSLKPFESLREDLSSHTGIRDGNDREAGVLLRFRVLNASVYN